MHGHFYRITHIFCFEAVPMGRRPELVGGGLIRSLGGWDEVKKMRLAGQDRIKSDQRILGENFEKVAEKVSSLFNLEKDYITGKGRQRDRVRAKDLLCYWCAIELRISMADLSKRLDMTLAAVSYAVKRGEKIAKEAGCHLND